MNRLFKNKTFIGLNLAVFLMMLGVGMIVALLPRKVLDLTGSPSIVGYLASSFALSYIILQLPIGNLSDRFGFKPFIAAGYLLCFLMSKKQILTALLGITLYGAGYGIFLTVIPAFLITGKNSSQMLVSIFFSLFYVAISFSQIITGPLSDKMGRKFFMIIGLIIAAAGTAAFPALGQPWISVLLTVASLGLGVFYLSSMAFLNETVSDSLKGTISGAYYLFWGIGYFFGPVIVGKLEELSHYNMGFYVFAMALFIEAAVLMATFMQSSSKKESPQNI